MVQTNKGSSKNSNFEPLISCKVNHQSFMRQLITAVIIGILVVIFALQNDSLVTVQLIFWEVEQASMALVLAITLVLGLISGMLFMAPGIYRRNQIIDAQKKRILEIEKQVSLKK